jgi:hypothetical protein
MPAEALRLLFVTPPLEGPATGGTLYNQQLLAALTSLGVAVRRSALEATAACMQSWRPDQVWVDSLYLASVPELARAAMDTRVGLLLHYLPSLLAEPPPDSFAALHPHEQQALLTADLCIVPSSSFLALLQRWLPDKRFSCASPGIAELELPLTAARDLGCTMVCNVTENKGVLPFLAALHAHATPNDAFRLEIVGRLDFEPAYAKACQTITAAIGGERVRHLGGLEPQQVRERVARSRLFVSASRMESYGMALAEARALGTPILAHAGGHVAAHVDAAAGGELCLSTDALAQAFLQLMRDPAELDRRLLLAAARCTTRSWEQTARDFLAACAH